MSAVFFEITECFNKNRAWIIPEILINPNRNNCKNPDRGHEADGSLLNSCGILLADSYRFRVSAGFPSASAKSRVQGRAQGHPGEVIVVVNAPPIRCMSTLFEGHLRVFLISCKYSQKKKKNKEKKINQNWKLYASKLNRYQRERRVNLTNV